MNEKQRQFRATGLAIYVVAAALVLMRILSYFVSLAMLHSTMAEWKQELILDACFTIPLQVGVLFFATLLIYKFTLKKSVKEVLELSNYTKPQGKKIALAVLMGFCVYLGTMGVSAIWRAIISMFGYTSSSSASVMPSRFNFGLMFVSLLLTAVLPAICEEFATRGILSRTLDNSFSETKTIVLGGLAFGLFHQYIEQFFYTFVFGMLLTFIVIRTRCIWYGMIVHFINNAISVYMQYAQAYDFALGGGFDDMIDRVTQSNFGVGLIYLVFAAGLIASILLAKAIAGKKKQVTDAQGNIAYGKVVYVPTKWDKIWFGGAITISVLVTIFTFVFGFLR